MYNTPEVKGTRQFWSTWLSGFVVGEVKEADKEDQKRIAVSISNVFHRSNLARFKIRRVKEDDSLITITRTA